MAFSLVLAVISLAGALMNFILLCKNRKANKYEYYMFDKTKHPIYCIGGAKCGRDKNGEWHCECQRK